MDPSTTMESHLVILLFSNLTLESNCDATFQVELLQNGDIEPNPGPDRQPSTTSHITGTADVRSLEISSKSKVKRWKDCKLPISRCVLKTIRYLGIYKRKKKTRRGTHGSLHKKTSCGEHYSIPVIIQPRTGLQAQSWSEVCLNQRQIIQANLTVVKTVPHFTKLCTLNMRSVMNKISAFTDFVLENDFDIIAICETWLRDGDNAVISRITPDGYSFQHRPREEKAGGGVGLLFKSSLSITVQQVTPYRWLFMYWLQVTPVQLGSSSFIVQKSLITKGVTYHLAYSLMSLA